MWAIYPLPTPGLLPHPGHDARTVESTIWLLAVIDSPLQCDEETSTGEQERLHGPHRVRGSRGSHIAGSKQRNGRFVLAPPYQGVHFIAGPGGGSRRGVPAGGPESPVLNAPTCWAVDCFPDVGAETLL